jgi:hypothetical protein
VREDDRRFFEDFMRVLQRLDFLPRPGRPCPGNGFRLVPAASRVLLIQRLSMCSLMPKSAAMWLTGCSCLATSSTDSESLPPVGKEYTQGIEGENLSFRIRIKRLARETICFSKLDLMYDTLIGLFINILGSILINCQLFQNTTPYHMLVYYAPA